LGRKRRAGLRGKVSGLGWNFAALFLLLSNLFVLNARAGVTIITHGLNGNVDGWITGMANAIPQYPAFFGTNFSGYQMSFSNNGAGYYLVNSGVAGSPATTPESGEVIIKLDWRNLADGDSYDTYQVAGAVLPALLSTNFIPDLGGHAIAEFPLHLIGHSRGGSLICELSRLLGTNGVWVDHLTTLDPHPLNDPAFPLDSFLYSAHDAPANTYVNVLFHDNYWQNIDTIVYGKPVAGAYVRKLLNLSGGYSSSHSDVHLWYHGTLDFRMPASDTEVSITNAQRAAWWSAYEASGTNAGFYYTLINGGDRTSTNRPAGAGSPMVREGYNQNWDLGIGTLANRTGLPSNSGDWPNLIKFNRMTTNKVEQGQEMPVKFYYQWAKPNTNLATISIYLDNDFNPLNTNQTLIRQIAVPGNGSSSVSFSMTNLMLFASNATPGLHTILAQISGGGRVRYFYARERIEVLALRQPPTMEIAQLNSNQCRVSVVGAPGQLAVVQSSTNLLQWISLGTNTLVNGRWDFTNSPSDTPGQLFYRSLLP
jgi:hypothetical protein